MQSPIDRYQPVDDRLATAAQLERGEPAAPLLRALREQGWHEEKWFDYLARMIAAGGGPAVEGPTRLAG